MIRGFVMWTALLLTVINTPVALAEQATSPSAAQASVTWQYETGA